MNKTHPNPGPAARLPPLDALRGFEAAARLMSFTRAAAELHVTQSAVSRQIKTVEAALGVPLFRRHNRRLELTRAGEQLLSATARALADIEGVVAEIRGPLSRVITVTTPLSFASLWLVPRLSAFRARHPGIDVRIAADDSILSLERERIDCAIRFCEPAVAPRDAAPLMSEEAFPVASPALLRRRRLKRPADLAGHVLLRYADSHQVPWLDWSTWLAAWGLSDLKSAGTLTFSHYDQLIAAAVEGEGVAIGRTPHVARLIDQGRLVVPFSDRLAAARQYFVVLSRASRARDEVRAFAAWAQAAARGE
ncbi:MAG: transcriptional regulator GcvA [Burkholderiales bacterium]|nr:transcriptional regulator GcvA [Burkholderiales bacterium]